jgi:hypothetical protein
MIKVDETNKTNKYLETEGICLQRHFYIKFDIFTMQRGTQQAP